MERFLTPKYFMSFLKNHPDRFCLIIIGLVAGITIYLYFLQADRPHLDQQVQVGGLSEAKSTDDNSDSCQVFREAAETTPSIDTGPHADESTERSGYTGAAEKDNLLELFPEEEDELDTSIEETIARFEDRVLNHTSATRVRVETKFQPDAGAKANQKLPGYVAFTTSAEGYHPDGVALTMEEIAVEYFTQFPGTPRVRVSLVVGGRVAGGRTFKPEDVY